MWNCIVNNPLRPLKGELGRVKWELNKAEKVKEPKESKTEVVKPKEVEAKEPQGEEK